MERHVDRKILDRREHFVAGAGKFVSELGPFVEPSPHRDRSLEVVGRMTLHRVDLGIGPGGVVGFGHGLNVANPDFPFRVELTHCMVGVT
jgi:hypothetical protein